MFRDKQKDFADHKNDAENEYFYRLVIKLIILSRRLRLDMMMFGTFYIYTIIHLKNGERLIRVIFCKL